MLRDGAGITSPKDGCSPQGQCGACLVLVDGHPKTSCAIPARNAAGKSVLTLEGVPEGERRIYGEAFARTAGLQCGFCIPGIALRMKSVLDANANPTDEEIKRKLDPHLCRCTGYVKIVDAFHAAARLRRGEPLPPPDVSGRVGTSLDRYEAEELTLGTRPYVADLVFPGMLHGAVTLSPHARARVKRIDTSRAAGHPGVMAVVTARDVPGKRFFGLIVDDWPGFVAEGEETHYVGDVLAAVAAVDARTARAAAALVDVEYEVLPPVTDPEEALRPGAPRVGRRGQPPLALGRQARRRRGRARGVGARRRGHVADAAHRAPVPRARGVSRRAGRRRGAEPEGPRDPLHAGPGHLRRPAAGRRVPRA